MFIIVQIIVMNKFFIPTIACTFFLWFSSCIKVVPTPTQLQMQVLDYNGFIVPNAAVYLYANQSDFLNDRNLLQTATTDPNGYFYFSNLAPTTYYYYVKSGCLDNFNTSYYLSQPLLSNQLNQYNPIYLEVSGTVSTKNVSNDPYDVYIDGVLKYRSQPRATTVDFTEISGGNHVVRVIQVSGFLYQPIDETFTVNVACGVSPTVTYPQ